MKCDTVIHWNKTLCIDFLFFLKFLDSSFFEFRKCYEYISIETRHDSLAFDNEAWSWFKFFLVTYIPLLISFHSWSFYSYCWGFPSGVIELFVLLHVFISAVPPLDLYWFQIHSNSIVEDSVCRNGSNSVRIFYRNNLKSCTRFQIINLYISNENRSICSKSKYCDLLSYNFF